jgi:hypothetical protein
MKAPLLVVVFWAVGAPLIVLSFVALPRALSQGSATSRVVWALVPVAGLLVAIGCLRTLLRIDARAGGAAFDRQWFGRYYRELLPAFIVYLALFAMTMKIAPTVQGSGARVLVGLAPVLGIALILIAVVRLIRRADEYHRRRLLESIAVTAAITVLWTSGYSFLEIAGFPRLHMFWVPVSMMVMWVTWSVGRALLGL